MGAFGEILYSRRMELGYTLEQVEEETKIRKYYIQALEEENFAALPAKVYAVGFVRRYARFLGLNEEEAAAWFKEMAYEEEETLGEEALPVRENRASLNLKIPLERVPVKNIAAGIIFLFLALWAGKYLVGYMSARVQEDKPGSTVTETTPPGTPAVEPETPAPKPTPRPPEPVPPSTPEKQPAEQQQPAPAPVQQPEKPVTTRKITVQLSATDRSWVSVFVDGEHAFSGIMEPNEETEFQGEKITLNLGNAGGVMVSVDGRNLGYLGGPSQVLNNKTFTASQ